MISFKIYYEVTSWSMFTNKNKIKNETMKIKYDDKQIACVVSTRVRSGLVYGLSWIGLAAPTTP